MSAATLAAPPPLPARAAEPPHAPAAHTPRAPGYFQTRAPAAFILAAFPFLTLPVAAVTVLAPTTLLLWVYVWLFGMTHFVVTLAVYMQSANLRHFAASRRNRLVFFAAPLLILVGFDLAHAFRLGAAAPLVAVYAWAAVRLFDFHHFNRQSFGVLQLFKARTGAKLPGWLKRAESLYFYSLVGLLYVSFLAGGVCPLLLPGGPLTVWPVAAPLAPALLPLAVSQAVWVGVFGVAAGLFAAAVGGLVREARRAGGKPGFAAAVGYLLAQTASAALPAVYFPLYLAALAMHYVEYHVLMAPRCLRTPLDPASRVDRVYGRLRASPVMFYTAVVAVAGLVTATGYVGMGQMGAEEAAVGKPFAYLMLLAVFDGLFVFHYFVEMFIWRFSDPHFRKTLGGLYFAPAK